MQALAVDKYWINVSSFWYEFYCKLNMGPGIAGNLVERKSMKMQCNYYGDMTRFTATNNKKIVGQENVDDQRKLYRETHSHEKHLQNKKRGIRPDEEVLEDILSEKLHRKIDVQDQAAQMENKLVVHCWALM